MRLTSHNNTEPALHGLYARILSGLLCTIAVCSARGVVAQPSVEAFPAKTAPAFASADTQATLPAQLATITTDTGDFAPGNRDFSRYTTPALCRGAALWERTVARRTLEALASHLASLQHIPAGQDDTVGMGAVVAVARACGARFTVATVADRDLVDLFHLALLEENDSLAQAILVKRLAHAATPQEQRTIRVGAMAAYLHAKPARVAPANALLAQLDAGGAFAADERLQLHAQRLAYLNQRSEALTVRDTAALRAEAERILAIGRADQNHTEAQLNAMQAAYETLMELAVFESPDSMTQVALRAKHDLSDIPIERWKDLPLQEVIERLVPEWYNERRRWFGQPAPPLQVDALLPAAGPFGADTLRLVPGHVNLLCMGGISAGAEVARLVQEWVREYRTAGLVVTLVAPAAGYVSDWMSDGDVFEILWATSQDETSAWQWYYHTYENLPVTVVLQHRPTTAWLPAPDARRLTVADLQFNQYGEGKEDLQNNAGSCTVIDRDGRIVTSQHSGEVVIQDVLRWLFTGPGAHPAPPLMVPGKTPPPVPQSLPRSAQGLSQ